MNSRAEWIFGRVAGGYLLLSGGGGGGGGSGGGGGGGGNGELGGMGEGVRGGVQRLWGTSSISCSSYAKGLRM